MFLREYLHQEYAPNRLDLTRGSLDQLAIAVRLLDRWRGREVAIADLSPRLLMDWLQHLAKLRAAATVNSKRGAILAIWNDAAEKGLCPPPPRRLPKRREPTRIPKAFNAEQINALLAVCAKQPGTWDGCPVSLCWIALVLMFWDTAPRIGQFLLAKLDSVDLADRTWHCPAETIKGRRADRLYRLHPQTVTVLRQVADFPRQMLFPFPHDRRRIWEHFARLKQAAGLPAGREWQFHALRRTAESHAAKIMGIEWAAAAVGHSPAVARKSYISPLVYEPPALVDVLPRPELVL